MWLEACSGLKINLDNFLFDWHSLENWLVLIGDTPDFNEVVEALGYNVAALLTTHLALAFGAPYKYSRVWVAVEESFTKGCGTCSIYQKWYMHLILLTNFTKFLSYLGRSSLRG